ERSTRVSNFAPVFPKPTAVLFLSISSNPLSRKIFQHDVVGGSIERALSGPGFIAVEEAYVTSMGWALGSSVTLVSQIAPQGEEPGRVVYEFAAIYRMPPNISSATYFPVLSLMHEYAKPLYAAASTGG